MKKILVSLLALILFSVNIYAGDFVLSRDKNGIPASVLDLGSYIETYSTRVASYTATYATGYAPQVIFTAADNIVGVEITNPNSFTVWIGSDTSITAASTPVAGHTSGYPIGPGGVVTYNTKPFLTAMGTFAGSIYSVASSTGYINVLLFKKTLIE